MQQPTFSVRIIEQPVNADDILVGVAINSSHYTQDLRVSSWCYIIYGYNFDHNSMYSTSPYKTVVNDTLTVSVNVTQKTIEYKVNGNSTGPPRLMSISDSEFQLLRPVVELWNVGECVEIYP